MEKAQGANYKAHFDAVKCLQGSVKWEIASLADQSAMEKAEAECIAQKHFDQGKSLKYHQAQIVKKHTLEEEVEEEEIVQQLHALQSGTSPKKRRIGTSPPSNDKIINMALQHFCAQAQVSLASHDAKILKHGKAMLMAADASEEAAAKELDEFWETLDKEDRGPLEVIPWPEEVSEGDFEVEGEVSSNEGEELEWEDYLE